MTPSANPYSRMDSWPSSSPSWWFWRNRLNKKGNFCWNICLLFYHAISQQTRLISSITGRVVILERVRGLRSLTRWYQLGTVRRNSSQRNSNQSTIIQLKCTPPAPSKTPNQLSNQQKRAKSSNTELKCPSKETTCNSTKAITGRCSNQPKEILANKSTIGRPRQPKREWRSMNATWAHITWNWATLKLLLLLLIAVADKCLKVPGLVADCYRSPTISRRKANPNREGGHQPGIVY